jgi:hypothetical protein
MSWSPSIVTAHVNPDWLLTGQGEKYDQRSKDQQ